MLADEDTIVRPSSYSYEDLLACSRGELFGPGNAQLPAPNMLMMDRITHIDEAGGTYNKGHILAELDIKPDLWFFECHFKNDPVMPGCLGLDAMWQMVGFYLGWLGHPGRGRGTDQHSDSQKSHQRRHHTVPEEPRRHRAQRHLPLTQREPRYGQPSEPDEVLPPLQRLWIPLGHRSQQRLRLPGGDLQP